MEWTGGVGEGRPMPSKPGEIQLGERGNVAKRALSYKMSTVTRKTAPGNKTPFENTLSTDVDEP